MLLALFYHIFGKKIGENVMQNTEKVQYQMVLDYAVSFAPYCFNHSVPRRKSPTPKGVGLFLAGALGLEPRAYGFGDRRSTN